MSLDELRQEIAFGLEKMTILENLMAFRHVATKIYGFLIDWNKLEVAVNDIQRHHVRIVKLFEAVVAGLEAG